MLLQLTTQRPATDLGRPLDVAQVGCR